MSERTLRDVRLGDDGMVFLRLSGASALIGARALQVGRDADGHLQSLVLDRLIHHQDESAFKLSLTGSPYNTARLFGPLVTEIEFAHDTQ